MKLRNSRLLVITMILIAVLLSSPFFASSSDTPRIRFHSINNAS